MSRGSFMRLYGYDEEFSGGYGSEDFRFVKFRKHHGHWQHHLPKRFFCHRRALDLENSYHSLKRDLARNTALDIRKRSELLYWGAEAGHSRLFLNFKWEVVTQRFRIPSIQRQANQGWKHRWWFRTLFGTR